MLIYGKQDLVNQDPLGQLVYSGLGMTGSGKSETAWDMTPSNYQDVGDKKKKTVLGAS